MTVRDGRWKSCLPLATAMTVLLAGATTPPCAAAESKSLVVTTLSTPTNRGEGLVVTCSVDGASVEHRATANRIVVTTPTRLRFRVLRSAGRPAPLSVTDVRVFVHRSGESASRRLAPVRGSQPNTWQVAAAFPEAGDYVVTFSFVHGGKRSGVSFSLTVKNVAAEGEGSRSADRATRRSFSSRPASGKQRLRVLLDAPPMRLRPVGTTTPEARREQVPPKPDTQPVPVRPPAPSAGSVRPALAAVEPGLVVVTPSGELAEPTRRTTPQTTRPRLTRREMPATLPSPAALSSRRPTRPGPTNLRKPPVSSLWRMRSVRVPAAVAHVSPPGRFVTVSITPQAPALSLPGQQLRAAARLPTASPRSVATLRSTRSRGAPRLAAGSPPQVVGRRKRHKVNHEAVKTTRPALVLRPGAATHTPAGRPVLASSPASGAPGPTLLSEPPAHRFSPPSLSTHKPGPVCSTPGAIAATPPLTPSSPGVAEVKPQVRAAAPPAHLRSPGLPAVTAAPCVLPTFPQPPPTRPLVRPRTQITASLQPPRSRRERVRPTRLVLRLPGAVGRATPSAPAVHPARVGGEVRPVVRTRPSPLVAGCRGLLEITLLQVTCSAGGIMSSEPTEAHSLTATVSPVGRPERQAEVRRVVPARRVGTYRLFRYFPTPGRYILRLAGVSAGGQRFATRVPLDVGRR